jgi:WD40 repeat protein
MKHSALSDWLAGLGLEAYLNVLVAEGYEAPDDLIGLQESDLEKLGFKMKHRKDLLKALAQQPSAGSSAGASEAPLPPPERPSVFLSYGHDPGGISLAERLYGDLKRTGFDPWMDSPPAGGVGIAFNDDWRARITEEIRKRDHMIALLSRHSTRDPGVCREEIALAIGPLNTAVYTVLIQDANEITPPLIVSRRQWLDMSEWRARQHDQAWYDEQFAKILHVLRTREGFSGDMEALRQWLKPNTQFANRIESSLAFIGREWLLGGLGGFKAGCIAPTAPPGDTATGPGPNASQIGVIDLWASRTGHSTRVFWLCAEPGWGKSAVIARLAHAGGARVLAVHFCRHDESLTRDAREFVRSLAYQMASQITDYRQALLSVCRAWSDRPFGDCLPGDLFHLLIREPLRSASIDGGRIHEGRLLIAIDALDEALDPDGQSELLDLLARTIDTLPDWIGLVITSRPESAVINRFKHIQRFNLESFDGNARLDVERCATDWVEQLIRDGTLDPARRAMTLARILSLSEGNFHYLQTLRLSLQGSISLLDELESAGLQPGFGSLYRQWFARRFTSLSVYESETLPLLNCVLAASEAPPLDLIEQIEPARRKMNSALNRLGSFLIQDRGRLHLVHKSLCEWLLDQDRTGHEWAVDLGAGHHLIAATLAAQWRIDREQGDRDFFGDWGDAARRYALAYLPAHLRGERPVQRQLQQQVLSHFGFAMERCAVGAVDALLEDLLVHIRRDGPAELVCWRDAMATSGHLLRQAAACSVAQQTLLQISLERPTGDPLRQSAQAWIARQKPNWSWLQRVQPANSRRGIALTIDLGAQVATDAHEKGAFSSHVNILAISADWSNSRVSVSVARCGRMTFDLRTGRKIHHVQEAEGDNRAAARTPSDSIRQRRHSEDGSIIVERHKDHSLWRCYARTDQRRALRGAGARLYDIALTPDGCFTAAVGEEGLLQVWQQEALIHARIAHAYRATRVSLSPDGSRALTVGHDGKLHLWELGAPTIEAAASEVTAMAELRPTDQSDPLLFVANARGEIRVASDASGPLAVPRFQGGHDGRVWDLAVSHCGRWLVSSGDDGAVLIHETKSGRLIARHQACRARAACKALAISANGEMAFASAGSSLSAWNLEATVAAGCFREPVWERSPGSLHRGDIRALCALQDRVLASAGEDGQVLLIDAGNDGRPIAALDHGHARESATNGSVTESSGGVYTLARSLCGRYLACSGRGRDRAISIWDVAEPASPRLINVLHGHLRGTHFLAFDDDGERLWSGSWDQTLALWNWHRTTSPRELIQPVAGLSVACRTMGASGVTVGTALGEVFGLELQE